MCRRWQAVMAGAWRARGFWLERLAGVCLERKLPLACVVCACVLVSEARGVWCLGHKVWEGLLVSPRKPRDPSVDPPTVCVLQQGSGKGFGYLTVVVSWRLTSGALRWHRQTQAPCV